MLKIAFLLTQSLDSPSGLGRFGPMARELSRRGHHVEIYALHPEFDSLPLHSNPPQGPIVHYVAPMHVMKSGSTKTYYPGWKLLQIALQASIHLSGAALRTSADILQVCKPHPMNSFAGLLGQAIQGKTVYLDCDDYETGVGHFSGRWQKSLVSAVETRVPRRVTSVTTNTQFMRGKLITWGVPSKQISYIPNGVELDRFSPPDQNELLRIRHQYDLVGKQVISFIGTVGFHGHPVNLLMNAFSEIHSQQADSVLLIVGGGEDLDALKAQVTRLGLEQHVRFTGRIPPDKISLYYYLSQISVDPVQDDDAARGRSPLKMFESWACGVPFVTADVGDRASLIGSPPAGLLARPGDASSLAEKILQLIREPALTDQLRLQGLDKVRDYSWEALAGRLEQLYLAHQAG